jgi:hypothetical protein
VATVRSGPEELARAEEPAEAARDQRPETAVAIGHVRDQTVNWPGAVARRKALRDYSPGWRLCGTLGCPKNNAEALKERWNHSGYPGSEVLHLRRTIKSRL